MKNKKFQIVINGDGDTTEARMFIDGKLIRCAQAQRNPADKPNWKIAAELAFGRLWDKKAEVKQNHETHRCFGTGRIVCVATYKPLEKISAGKQFFHVGDRVRILQTPHLSRDTIDAYGTVICTDHPLGFEHIAIELDKPVECGHEFQVYGQFLKVQKGCGLWVAPKFLIKTGEKRKWGAHKYAKP